MLTCLPCQAIWATYTPGHCPACQRLQSAHSFLFLYGPHCKVYGLKGKELPPPPESAWFGDIFVSYWSGPLEVRCSETQEAGSRALCLEVGLTVAGLLGWLPGEGPGRIECGGSHSNHREVLPVPTTSPKRPEPLGGWLGYHCYHQMGGAGLSGWGRVGEEVPAGAGKRQKQCRVAEKRSSNELARPEGKSYVFARKEENRGISD